MMRTQGKKPPIEARNTKNEAKGGQLGCPVHVAGPRAFFFDLITLGIVEHGYVEPRISSRPQLPFFLHSSHLVCWDFEILSNCISSSWSLQRMLQSCKVVSVSYDVGFIIEFDVDLYLFSPPS